MSYVHLTLDLLCIFLALVILYDEFIGIKIGR